MTPSVPLDEFHVTFDVPRGLVVEGGSRQVVG